MDMRHKAFRDDVSLLISAWHTQADKERAARRLNARDSILREALDEMLYQARGASSLSHKAFESQPWIIKARKALGENDCVIVPDSNEELGPIVRDP